MMTEEQLLIDVEVTEEYGLQPVLSPIDQTCGVIKLQLTKTFSYNHVFFYLKDQFANQIVGIVIDPFRESKTSFVAFRSVTNMENALTALEGSRKKMLGATPEISESTRERYESAQQCVRAWNWQERYYPSSFAPTISQGNEALDDFSKQVCSLARTLGGSDIDPIKTETCEVKPPGLTEAVSLNYQILGPANGQPVVFIPPGQASLMQLRQSARAMCRSRTGLRGLLFDRRNTGASDISFEHVVDDSQTANEYNRGVVGEKGTLSEMRIQAADLHLLLQKLNLVKGEANTAAPRVRSGTPKGTSSVDNKNSSGSKGKGVKKEAEIPSGVILYGEMEGASLAVLYASLYPETVTALVLVNPAESSGEGMGMIAEGFYEKYSNIAKFAGMAGVARTSHYSAIARLNAKANEKILGTEVDQFCACMKAFGSAIFLGGGKKMGEVVVRKQYPVLGVAANSLKAIKAKAMVIYSLTDADGDTVHTPGAARAMAKGLRGCKGGVTVVSTPREWLGAVLPFIRGCVPLQMQFAVKQWGQPDPMLAKAAWPEPPPPAVDPGAAEPEPDAEGEAGGTVETPPAAAAAGERAGGAVGAAAELPVDGEAPILEEGTSQ